MRKIFVILILSCLLVGGCEGLRFAPDESQKQNAWLHNRTALFTADTAKTENASEKLQSLAQLSELQSRAFTSYFGLPKEFPKADTADDILTRTNEQLAQTALNQSAARPDVFAMADNVIGLALGICGLLGGVYGTKAVGFLQQAQTKSKALQEIISGNELFKEQHPDAVTAFKQAQAAQSPQTRQLVAELKA